MAKVLVVGSAEQSGGGVSTVIRLMKQMQMWKKYHCTWLGTQIQAGVTTKLWYAFKAYVKALFIIWRYDIVHFHTVPNVSMKIQLPVFFLAKIAGKKIVMHLHVCNQLAMPEYVDYSLAHWCLKKADFIVLLAYKAKELLDTYWKDINTKRCVVYNPCQDIDAIPYEKHKKTILYAGRFTDNKCGWLLIKAFNLLKDKYPEWTLQLLGDGEEKYIYQQLIEEYGLKDRVEMPGFVYGEDLARYYRMAGIYGMTSHYEGVPMVVIDAWSYGVPVVSTPVGGLPEMLVEDKNGCVYDFDDYEGLAKKLDHLMGNFELRKQMSEYCKEFAVSHFSMDTINEKWEKLYNDIIKNRI